MQLFLESGIASADSWEAKAGDSTSESNSADNSKCQGSPRPSRKEDSHIGTLMLGQTCDTHQLQTYRTRK